MNYWKINCMAKKYPSLWQTWFLEQTVAIGWPPPRWNLEEGLLTPGWAPARKAAKLIHINDKIVVQLNDGHVGRIGTVTSIKISDKEWKPTVPKDSELPFGEMGRRIEVRWDLTSGPVSPSAIAKLPDGARFKGPALRYTIARLREADFKRIERELLNEDVWTSMNAGFRFERSMSDYISSFPYLLEEGMRTYPKCREYSFKDGTRIDVLLLDRKESLVIIECKQDAPTLKDLDQVRGYVRNAKQEILGNINRPIRAILIHGGPRKIDPKVVAAARKLPKVEIIRGAVAVDFASSL